MSDVQLNVELKQEKAKLHKVLRRWDLVFFSVCALVGLDAVAGLAKSGLWESVTWFVIFIFIYILPYGLITSELGAAFPAEGGIYTWVRMAYGKLAAGISAMLYWIANPIWIGGTLAAVSIAAINSFFMKPNGHADLGWLPSTIIGLIFVWANIGIAVVSLKHGKWAGNIGAYLKAAAVVFFSILVIGFLIKKGLPAGHAPISGLKPSITGFLAVIGLIVFLVTGFELEAGASEEMVNPQHDVPIGVLRSGVLSTILYIAVVAGILIALPEKTVAGVSGFTGSFQTVNQAVFGTGGGAKFLGYIFAIIIILTLVGSGSVWILGSCRVQALVALDGAAPRFLGRFSKQGTPSVMAILSGIIGSLFVIYLLAVLKGSLTNFFSLMLDLAVSTTVLAFIFMFPAVITLRKKFPDVHRPFRVPGGTFGLWLCVILTEACVILTGFTFLWPGFIDRYIFGKSYSIATSWGVGRTYFEVITLGSFIVIILLAVGFWAWGRVETKGEKTTEEGLIEGVIEEDA
jgi:amino acid transporter